MSGQYLYQEIIISQIVGLQQKTIALILYHGSCRKRGVIRPTSNIRFFRVFLLHFDKLA